MWVSAVLLLILATMGPLDWIGERRVLSAHMVQHLLLMSAVPALLLFAWPATWSKLRMTGALAAACLVGAVGAIWLFHMPIALEAGLENAALQDAQHLGLVAAGLVLALPLTPAGKALGFGAAFYLVAAELSIGALGVWLAWSPDLLYTAYADAPRTWGLSVETDQALAGALLLVVEEPFLAVEFAAVFIAALGSQDADGG